MEWHYYVIFYKLALCDWGIYRKSIAPLMLFIVFDVFSPLLLTSHHPSGRPPSWQPVMEASSHHPRASHRHLSDFQLFPLNSKCPHSSFASFHLKCQTFIWFEWDGRQLVRAETNLDESWVYSSPALLYHFQSHLDLVNISLRSAAVRAPRGTS